MTFCIECGTKAPDVAKFCPNCGSGLIIAEPVKAPISAEVTPEIETPKEVETKITETVRTKAKLEPAKPEPIKVKADVETGDTPLSAAASLAAAASVVEEAPKSKAGLFVGLGLVTLFAAGGGAYALGLFGGGDTKTQREVSAPVLSTPTGLPKTEAVETDTPSSDPIQKAYGEAIRSGRISDLGKFANDNPKSSLAKDAETAAFDSLQRQGSVLAYNTFAKYFPDADTSSYSGARVNSDEISGAGEAVEVEFSLPGDVLPTVRTSITTRGEALEPFIAQGDTDYAFSVVDEMLAYSDLNESEATYLVNLRARAENTKRFSNTTEIELVRPTQIDPVINHNIKLGSKPNFQPSLDPEPEITVLTVPEPTAPEPVVPAPAAEITPPEVSLPTITTPEIAGYDTAAKPIERFGAITPDDATNPGECNMTFSVDVSGSPTSIVADCTDSIFIQPAQETVSEWTYSPALLAGAPVQQDGLVVTLKFHLE